MARPPLQWLTVALATALIACTPPSAPHAPGGPLAALESSYQRLRYWDDQQRLLASLAGVAPPETISPAAQQDSLAAARTAFRLRREPVAAGRLSASDALALATMDREARHLLASRGDTESRAPEHACKASVAGSSGADSLAALTDRIVACYGRAASTIVLDGDTLNRLEILGLLARTDAPARRQRLFLALAPVWHSVNGDDGHDSPYRTMVRLRRQAWGDSASPINTKAPAFGLTTPQLEQWLTAGLEQWRAAMPDTLLEPWDWYYAVGEATRRLTPRVPSVASIRQVNDRFYAALGADPVALRIHYDLEPRPLKYPVAYTDFGRRNQWEDGRLLPGEPWVFTSYQSGGFDNLAELLHETGHAIHLAGLRTRPAYLDWPDNDTFTEALADVASLDLYEPAWQQHFLGDSALLAASLRAKYASIVFDFAWALFEIRVHQRPDADPNVEWASITRDYLRIRPHPEWSWWAIRGQLIDGPGYLINYALGAFIVADLRRTIAQRWGAEFMRDPDRYQRLSAEIYRFGLERSSRAVLEQFLGRPVQSEALVQDLARLVPP